MGVQTNTFKAVLDSLGPTHTWALGESSGAFADTGSSGAAPLSDDASDINWRQPPGVIRGLPREFGYWTTGAAFDPGGGPSIERGTTPTLDASGFTTASMGFAGMAFSFFDDMVGLHVRYDSTSNEFMSVTVKSGASAGKVEFKCDFSNFSITGLTDNAVITLGVPFLIVCSQRADGTGLKINVNGVDVAVTTSLNGGSVTNNSWASDLFALAADTGTCSNVFVAADEPTPTVNTEMTFGIIQRPFIFVNNTLSNTQIIALHSAASLTGVGADYWDVLQDVTGLGRWGFCTGFVYENSDSDPLMNGGIPAGTAPAFFRSGAGGWAGVAAADTDLISDYAYQKIDLPSTTSSTTNVVPANDFDSTAGPNDINIPFDPTDTTGTMGFLLSMPVGIVTGESKPILTLITDTEAAELKVTASNSSGIYSVTFRLEELASGDFFQIVAVGVQAKILAQGLFLLTFVQDGSTGLKMYINDEFIGTTPSSSGSQYNANSWFAAMPGFNVSSGGCEFKLLGDNDFQFTSQGIWGANDFHGHFGTTKALTAAEITTLWASTKGTYPDADTAPVGGFTETLAVTGNSGTGPDHYWRMNASAAPIIDIGVASVKGTSRATGGDPTFEVPGPLITDPTNEAILFDGQGDYFEVGLDGVAGQLVTSNIGTVGFFLSRNDLATQNIAYSQSNNGATEFIEWYVQGESIVFFIQTSAGNTVTFTSNLKASTLDFFFIVMTNDATTYKFYVQGVLDTASVLALVGTGTQGLWFNDITATRSAVGARADASFNIQANSRVSELFIYEEVLTAAQIAALWAAAIANGSLGATNTVGVVSFDNVTFKNGGLADIRLQSVAAFQQVLKVKDCQFIGGEESATAQSISLKGAAVAQVSGSRFSLDATPTTGRAAIVASAISTSTTPTAYGSLVAVDNTFDRMGFVSGSVVRSPIFLEAAFGATIEKNRFFDCFGSAVGWRGDARQVQVLKNVIDTITSNVGAIYSQQGLNAAIGNNWLIEGNVIDVSNGNPIRLIGSNLAGTGFARNIHLLRNQVDVAATVAIFLNQLSDLSVKRNVIEGTATEGIRLGLCSGLVNIQQNEISGNTDEAIITSEATTQAVTLLIDGNTIESALVGDGILATNIARLGITNNKLTNVLNGLQIGNVTITGQVFGNTLTTVTTPFFLIGGTTQVAFEVGENLLTDLGTAKTLTVVSNAVQIIAPYHLLTVSGAADLNGLGALATEGYVVILQLAVGSSNITIKDAVGNIRTAGDFVMDTPGQDQIWLVRNGTNWDELSRFTG